MLRETLKDKRLILGSASPRRKEYLKAIDADFIVRIKDCEEVYPESLQRAEITEFLAKLKSEAFLEELEASDILITSDTIVWYQNKSWLKPKDRATAIQMLESFSGNWHEVITSVCFTTTDQQKVVTKTTEVKFCELSKEEIIYYVDHYDPYDKAGGYGIQDWLGMIAIEEINGSYHNVAGMPTQLVYKTLMDMVS